MNTFLSAAQQATNDQYQAFAREHLAPIASKLEDGSASLKEFMQKMGQEGYLGITVPKEYGGQGLPFLNAAMFAEAIGHHQAAVALAMAEHIAVIELIKKYGTDTQKSRYLPLLARGESLSATAFNEQNAGTDFKAAKSTAEKQSDGFAINGTKTIVVNAQDVGLLAVTALNGNQLELFLLDQSAGSTIKVGAAKELLGLRGVRVNDVEFADHKLSTDAQIPASNSGSDEQIQFAGDVAKTIVAAAALGMTEACVVASVAHANSREQFGQKIAQFQGIQWKVADMSVEMAASRQLVYRAAWAKDEDTESFRKDASMAKWYATKTARVHSSEAVQIMGVHGLFADALTEQFYRDAKVMEICEGTSEYQKVIIADELGV